jgi:hypothetical protein
VRAGFKGGERGHRTERSQIYVEIVRFMSHLGGDGSNRSSWGAQNAHLSSIVGIVCANDRDGTRERIVVSMMAHASRVAIAPKIASIEKRVIRRRSSRTWRGSCRARGGRGCPISIAASDRFNSCYCEIGHRQPAYEDTAAVASPGASCHRRLGALNLSHGWRPSRKVLLEANECHWADASLATNMAPLRGWAPRGGSEATTRASSISIAAASRIWFSVRTRGSFRTRRIDRLDIDAAGRHGSQSSLLRSTDGIPGQSTEDPITPENVAYGFSSRRLDCR